MKFKVDEPLAAADPRLGLDLRFAVMWFAQDQEIAQRYGYLNMRSRVLGATEFAITPGQKVELDGLRRMLASLLVGRLLAGELIAKGRRAGDLGSVSIPADFWRGVSLDIDTNSAEAGGTTLVALAIFDPAEGGAQTRLTAAEWMAANVTCHVPNQRDARVRECRIALAITKEEALAGRNTLPETIKGRSRTPGKSA